MSEYEFTSDWNAYMRQTWPTYVPKCSRVLEIGAYEGRGTCWIIENIMEDGGEIICVDTWEGGEEHSEHDMSAVFDRFNKNVAIATSKRNHKVTVEGLQRKSDDFLAGCPTRFPYDLIYIDGSHQAPDTLTDAVLAWRLLKPGGTMIFDDYEWMGHEQATHRPKMAINAFMSVFMDNIEVVHKGYQVAIRRKA